MYDWIKEDEWDFSFSDFHEGIENDNEKCGTVIKVTNLYHGISQNFKYIPFVIDIINVIRRRANAELALDEDTRTNIVEAISKMEAKNIHYYTACSITENTDISFVARMSKKFQSELEIEPMATVTYKAKKVIADTVKKHLGVSSNKDVGTKTLEYYIDMEEIDHA